MPINRNIHITNNKLDCKGSQDKKMKEKQSQFFEYNNIHAQNQENLCQPFKI